MPRRLLILGSTGLDRHPGARRRRALGASSSSSGCRAERSWEPLVEQARRLGVARIALADPTPRRPRRARRGPTARCSSAREGLVELVVESGADLVLNALVGSAGLGPTVAALGEGIDLALANKESLVVGGELVTALAEATGAAADPRRLRAHGAAPADGRPAASARSSGS